MKIKNKKTKYCESDKIIVGKIFSTYGVRGWVKIISFTENKVKIFSYQPWLIKNYSNWQIITLEEWKNYNKQFFIVKIKNIKNKEEAALLNKKEVFINETQLPILNEDEYYYKDILKCYVTDINGQLIGKVVELIKGNNTNDILVIKNELKYSINNKEELIPLLYDKVIKKIDIKNKIIEVNWNTNS